MRRIIIARFASTLPQRVLWWDHKWKSDCPMMAMKKMPKTNAAKNDNLCSTPPLIVAVV